MLLFSSTARRSRPESPRRAARHLFATIFILIAISTANHLAAHSVSLAWDPSGTSSVVGYRLHHGQRSGEYTETTDVGPATMTVISNLVSGATYYFAVTAVDVSGIESLPSNEIAYTTPGAAERHSFPRSVNVLTFRSDDTDESWSLEAAGESLDWKTIASNLPNSMVLPVVVSSDAALYFRIATRDLNGRLEIESELNEAAFRSFVLRSETSLKEEWIIEVSTDLLTWTACAAGEGPFRMPVILADPALAQFRVVPSNHSQ